MKRRLFSILLTLALCLGLMPAMVWAAEEINPDSWGALRTAIDTDGATIKLNQNIEAGSSDVTLMVSSGKKVILDLNGYTIDRGLSNVTVSSTTGAPVINVQGELTIKDSSAEGNGMITGGNNVASGGGIHVYSGGTLNLDGGHISGNTSSGNGTAGGVQVEGTFNMNGGSIERNNSETHGGGVSVSGGVFEMNEGLIANNTAKEYGGGVFAGYATFNLNGGIIRNNSAANGGGIWANQTTLNVVGGTITLNTARENGGGAFLNAPDKYGGGDYQINGGTITNNTATIQGGGIYMDGDASATVRRISMKGAPIIKDNTASSAASNVFLKNGFKIYITDKITDGAIVGITNSTEPTSANPIVFTNGFNTYNSSAEPDLFFFSDKSVNVLGKDRSGEIQLEAPIAYDINVSVTNIADGSILEGATVQIFKKDSPSYILEEWTSTNQPHTVSGLEPDVEYILRETIPPDGYVLASDISFNIDNAGIITSTGSITTDGVLLIQNEASVPYNLYICGTQVTSANAGDLSVISGVSGKVSYNDSTKTLTLKDATIQGNTVNTISVRTSDLTIAFFGTNTISTRMSTDYCRGIDAYQYGTLTFAGEENATLTVQTTHNNSEENGAIRGDRVVVTGGTVIAECPEDAYGSPAYMPYALSLNATDTIIKVTGGKLIAKGWAPLAAAIAEVKIDSGTKLFGSASFDGSSPELYDFDNNDGWISGWQNTYRYVEAVPKGSYNVTIGPGKYMTKKSGQESQTVSSGDAMTDVVYTADEGYYFPTDYSTAPVNGIGVTRNSFTQITVSGTPTAKTTFYPADATAKTKPAEPSVAATDCTTESNNDGTITGVDATMEYQKSGDTAWIAITGSEVEGLIPGTYSVRVAETDTTLSSDAVSVTIAEYNAPPKVNAPVFTPASGKTFTDTLDVTISIPDNATVYYTRDKSEPSETNGIMTTGAAIKLEETTTLKAIAISNDLNYENSDVVTATYTKTTPSSGGGGGTTTYPVKPASAENGSVTVSPRNAAAKSTVTITVTPDEGYVLDKLTVKDKDGNEIDVKDNGDGTYTFTMPASAIEIEATFKPEDGAAADGFPFIDVPENSYFRKPVEWAVEKDITNGVSEDKYGPEMSCTRAQVVTFLWITCGSEDAGIETGFDDVDVAAYYDKAVAWAVEKGITAGTSENEFSPDMTITRAQFVTMLWAAKGKPETAGEMPFLDVPAEAYYAKAVAWAYANDITAGKSADSFAPDDPCTRAQIMTFLYNAYAE